MKAEYMNKYVVITCKDGQLIKGKITDWTSSYDNEPDPESITINSNTEIYVNEIEKIEYDKSTQD